MKRTIEEAGYEVIKRGHAKDLTNKKYEIIDKLIQDKFLSLIIISHCLQLVIIFLITQRIKHLVEKLFTVKGNSKLM